MAAKNRASALRHMVEREERENSEFAADTAFVVDQEAALTVNQELAVQNQAAIRKKNDEEARERAWAERVKKDEEIAKWLLKPAESKELSAKALRRRQRAREKAINLAKPSKQPPASA